MSEDRSPETETRRAPARLVATGLQGVSKRLLGPLIRVNERVWVGKLDAYDVVQPRRHRDVFDDERDDTPPPFSHAQHLADDRLFLAVATFQISRRHYRKCETAFFDATFHLFEKCLRWVEIAVVDCDSVTVCLKPLEETTGECFVRILSPITDQNVVPV